MSLLRFCPTMLNLSVYVFLLRCLFVFANKCLLIFVCCGLMTDVVQSGNVTNVNMAQYMPQHDDLCTNECSETDPRYWCGGYKEDAM